MYCLFCFFDIILYSFTEHKLDNTSNESPIYWLGQFYTHRLVAFQSLKQLDHTLKYLAVAIYRQHYTSSSCH